MLEVKCPQCKNPLNYEDITHSEGTVLEGWLNEIHYFSCENCKVDFTVYAKATIPSNTICVDVVKDSDWNMDLLK